MSRNKKLTQQYGEQNNVILKWQNHERKNRIYMKTNYLKEGKMQMSSSEPKIDQQVSPYFQWLKKEKTWKNVKLSL